MSSPWIPDAGRPAPRLLVERAHDELVAGNTADPRLSQVRPLVRASWDRSMGSRVGVETVPVLELSGETLETYRREHPLAKVLPLIRSLLLPGELDEVGVIVAVGDAAGRLLWVEGDGRLRSRAEGMGFAPGVNWAEDRVGTAAPGTALLLGRSVQVRGPEHFNRFVQPWSCTAAPVRDPESGRLLGVIDVTGGDEVGHPRAQLLVDATARAVEGELLVERLRSRDRPSRTSRRTVRRSPPRSASSVSGARATLSVLGVDRALFVVVVDDGEERAVELGLRHAEIVLMLALHPQGLTAGRLAELVYGDPGAVTTLRPEIVRLRRLLDKVALGMGPESRPYRLTVEVETDVHHVRSLLERGAHRVALAAYRGEVLPGSTAPGVDDVRETVRATLRETLLAEAGRDVLLDYVESDFGSGDVDALRQVLRMLPARSPRRIGIVTRIERIESGA